MLLKEERLPYKEFHVPGWSSARTPYFTLKYRSNGLGSKRIGVIIGKNAEKSAVKRNFWKRQAKAQLQSLPLKNRDILILFGAKIKTLKKDQFKKEFSKILQTL